MSNSTTEETLTREAKFRQLVDTSIQGIAIFQDGRIIFANPAMGEITGYTLEQLLAMSPEETIAMVHPDDREGVKNNVRNYLAGLPVNPYYEHRLIRANGEIRYIELYASLTTHQGRPAIQAAYLDRTEQVRAEMALRDNEAKLRLITDNMRDMIIHTDGQGNIQYVSPSALKLWSTSPEELVGAHFSQWLKLVHPEDREMLGMAFIKRLASGEGPTIGTFRLQYPENEQRWHEYTVSIFREEDGSLAGYIYVIREVHQRIQAVLALQESEGRLRQAMNVGRLGIWEWDIATDKTYWIGDMFRIYGIKPEEFTGQGEDYLNFTLPEDRVKQRDNIARAFETGITEKELIENTVQIPYAPSQFRILRPDGTICYVQGDAIAIVNEDGKPVRMIGVLQDITDIHLALNALHQSEERYRRVSELTSDFAYAIQVGPDNSLKIEWMTEAFTRITGYPVEWIDINFGAHLLHPDDLPKYNQTIQNALAGYPSQEDLRLITADGSIRWLRTRNLPVWDKEANRTTYIYGAAQDITEQRQVEMAMQRAQKLESLGVLAGSVAHDFNNLLTSILTNASLIQLLADDGSPVAQYIESVIETAERAADITRHLLAYSGKGRFEVTQIDLNELVQKNMKLLPATLPKNITLSFEPMPQLPLIEGDAGQVQQVIMNLIINAADAYCDRPGHVLVTTTLLNINPHETDQWNNFDFIVLPETYCCLTVVDWGQGMDEKMLARIFDPFFTTKETGRGLGLAAVQGIIRGHRGTLKVTSEPEKGAEFQVLFPVSKSQTPVSRPPTVQSAESSDNLILIVDDEEAIREAIYEALLYLDYRVLSADNGEQAVELAQSHSDEISLILLDMTMPLLSGIETLALLQQKRIPLPVVMMSGYDEDETGQLQKWPNVVGFLKKPFRIETLAEAITQALAVHPA